MSPRPRVPSAPCQRCKFLHPQGGIGDSADVQVSRSIDEVDVVRLVARHQAEVWRYVRYLGASTELADDLVQEAFLQLLRAPFEQRSPEATGGWLRTVVRNLYVKSFRAPPFQLAELDTIEATWNGFAGDDGGEESLERLRACRDRLDGRAREVLRLHYEERRSRRDIGQRLGIGEDGVKSLLRRTRAVLRACIERREANA
jgi:RNA polymerase sigma-70 factor (ECF subfamily)